jgi:hypothetical protein
VIEIVGNEQKPLALVDAAETCLCLIRMVVVDGFVVQYGLQSGFIRPGLRATEPPVTEARSWPRANIQ